MDVLDRPLVPRDADDPDPTEAAGGEAGENREPAPYPHFVCEPLHLPVATFRYLLDRLGPSLALWRAAEIAALREWTYETPVLDLGCGDGLVTAMVLPRVEIGVDPDPVPLQRAARRGLYQSLVTAPIEEADIPASSIGTILSNSVLEHVPRIDDALAAAARCLRPGGRLILTVPTEAFSGWLTVPWPRYVWLRNQRLAHRNLWTATHWAERLRDAGLEVEVIRPLLRRPLVTLWDALDLTQQVWIGQHRLVSLLWRRVPSPVMDQLARWGAALDLAAPAPGGGRLIVARKPWTT